jgi:hypothetical protein
MAWRIITQVATKTLETRFLRWSDQFFSKMRLIFQVLLTESGKTGFLLIRWQLGLLLGNG